jgi:hypothetical protein
MLQLVYGFLSSFIQSLSVNQLCSHWAGQCTHSAFKVHLASIWCISKSNDAPIDSLFPWKQILQQMQTVYAGMAIM